MTLEEASGPKTEIFPDNLTTVNVFIAMLTQWRVGVNGATGLAYEALPFVMRTLGVPRAEWPEVFDGIRVMEDAAMQHMRVNK